MKRSALNSRTETGNAPASDTVFRARAESSGACKSECRTRGAFRHARGGRASRASWSGFVTGVILALTIATSAVAADADGWISLFDGQSLAGWKASESQSTFRVREGTITVEGPRSRLFYIGSGGADFTNFEFSAEVLCRPGGHSGIYFHTAYQATGWLSTGFEVLINNTRTQPDRDDDLRRTGSLDGIRNLYKSIVRDGEWFTLAIRVSGHRVQVRLNGTLVVDYLEPAVSREATDGLRRLAHGTFALQASDPKSLVAFKNLRVRPLTGPVAPADAQPTPVPDSYACQVFRLNQQDFPLVNFHAHLKGGLTLLEALEQSRAAGVNFGIAMNCGVGFSITNDAGIAGFLQSAAGQPIFVGMQAEGREWVKMFSRETVARFDYVFTDAMTFFDANGKRTRLWIKDEVTVGDKQAFMDTLVARTVTLLNLEPIDIYVNPTFLPDEIMKEYDTLWTPERMQQVIAAAVSHGVAIEINARYRIPSPTFLKLAKKAGAKFAFGTNNSGDDVGRLDYCFEMLKECGLTADDLFMPKPDDQKAAQLKW